MILFVSHSDHMAGFYISVGNIWVPGAMIVTPIDYLRCNLLYCSLLCFKTPGCVAFIHNGMDPCSCALLTGDVDLASAPEFGNPDWHLFRLNLV